MQKCAWDRYALIETLFRDGQGTEAKLVVKFQIEGGEAILQFELDEVVKRPDRFAILPLERDVDNDYFTMQMRNYFTSLGRQNGYELFTRSDGEWNQILEEIKWGDQFGDTMDAATVQKFGRIQGVQGLLMGRISSISKNEDGEPVVRVTVQAFEVETGKQVWGNEAKGLVEKPEDNSANPLEPLLAKLPGGWLTVGGIVLGVILLLVIVRMFAKAARPR